VALAREIYLDAQRLPAVTTAEHFCAAGLQLDGPLFEGSTLVYCFSGLTVLVVKSLDEREAARAAALQQSLPAELRGFDTSPLIAGHVMRFELREERGKHFMLMRHLAVTLEQMPWLAEQHSLVLWTHLRDGLHFLHSLGFAHCDVKPANVGLSACGTFQLIDLGSVSRFGEACSTTAAYVPRDLFARSQARASEPLDWWMAAMCLAEKCCSTREQCMPVGTASKSASKDELLRHVGSHLPPSLWESFQHSTTIC
jgi:Protein kinase domain